MHWSDIPLLLQHILVRDWGAQGIQDYAQKLKTSTDFNCDFLGPLVGVSARSIFQHVLNSDAV